uniref:Uncharacterized protein n=1 Tax=Cacopsylla melanoneura TaxID=428564 RepID=A0A8D8SJF5_9HEMI
MDGRTVGRTCGNDGREGGQILREDEKTTDREEEEGREESGSHQESTRGGFEPFKNDGKEKDVEHNETESMDRGAENNAGQPDETENARILVELQIRPVRKRREQLSIGPPMAARTETKSERYNAKKNESLLGATERLGKHGPNRTNARQDAHLLETGESGRRYGTKCSNTTWNQTVLEEGA